MHSNRNYNSRVNQLSHKTALPSVILAALIASVLLGCAKPDSATPQAAAPEQQAAAPEPQAAPATEQAQAAPAPEQAQPAPAPEQAQPAPPPEQAQATPAPTPDQPQPTTTILHRCASAQEGADLMLANDEYYAGFSQNDLYFRMQKKGATMEEYQSFAREQVVDFTEEEKAMVDGYFEHMAKVLEDSGYTLPPLDEIVLIKTTMKEENGVAGYTHGTQIYVGERVLADGLAAPVYEDHFVREFFWHELFHCLTRCNPQFRTDMYKLIHFTVRDEDYELPRACSSTTFPTPMSNTTTPMRHSRSTAKISTASQIS